MNKLITGIAIGIGVLCLLGAGWFATSTINRTDPAAHVLRDLNELRQLDTAWNLDTLEVSTRPSAHFDVLAEYLPRVRELKANLRDSELGGDQVPSYLNNQLFQYLSLIDAKEEAIERFKTNFAVIRNAEKYLPVAARRAIQLARDADKPDLVAQLQGVADLLSTFQQAPGNEGVHLRLSVDLGRLEEAQMEQRDELHNAIANLISHARVLSERLGPTRELLQRVLDRNSAVAGDSLIRQYGQFAAQRVLDVKGRLWSMFGLALLAGLALTGLGLLGLLRKPAASNTELEAKVAAHSAEIGKQNEAALAKAIRRLQAEKAASVDRMAASMAHEINTPLGFVDSNLQLLQESLPQLKGLIGEIEQVLNDTGDDDPEQRRERLATLVEQIQAARRDAMIDDLPDVLADMSEGLQQIDQVVEGLRTLGRKDRAQGESIDFNAIIESALKMGARQVEPVADVKRDLAEIPPALATPGEMRQLVLNLLVNAAHAIEDANRGRGLIEIATRLEGDHLAFAIKDNGVGMTDEVKKRLFEPFYTTKEAGRGTGLGMAIVMRIVRLNGGKLMVRSVPHKGTLIKVTLPVNAGEIGEQHA